MSISRLAGPEQATYSQATIVDGAGGWVFIAGQLPVTDDGTILTAGLAQETSVCLDHIERILHDAGATMRDVTSIRAYLTDLTDYGEFAEVRGKRFRDGLPASVAVGVAALIGGAHVEIEATAFVADGAAQGSP